jgi:SAM-dependent methyltransferase
VDVVGVDIQPIAEHPSLHICTPTTLLFADSSFDAIVSNMVFEHVMHPNEVLSELDRVLRPGGVMLQMWPSNEATFEGHCRLLFAQNLRSERYLRLCHMLVFGIRRQRKWTSKEFAEKWLRYMGEQCNYLLRTALTQLFHDAGFSFEHRERDHLRYRFGSDPMLAGRLLQKLTTMVDLSRRLSEQHTES